MAHIVSNTKPPNGEWGDEWFNPIENVTYKLLPASGTDGSWHAFGNVGTTVLSTTNNVTNVSVLNNITVTNTIIATTVLASSPGDVYWNWNSLLIDAPQSNTIVNFDASSNGLDVIPLGKVRAATPTPYQGNGYYSTTFNGTTDLLVTPSNTAFALGTGDFTVEAWFFSTTSVNNNACIFDFRASGGGSSQVKPTLQLIDRELRFAVSSTNRIVTPGILNGQWYHVALVRSSGVTRLYTNGVANATTYTDANDYGSSAQDMVIGQVGDSRSFGAGYWPGYISNLRVVKGTAVYTSTFNPTTPLTVISGTQLLTCCNNRINDSSTNAFTLTATGTPIMTPASPFDTSSSRTYGSARFKADYTNDYFNILSSSAFNFGTANFTIECWVYHTFDVTFGSQAAALWSFNGDNFIQATWDNIYQSWNFENSSGYTARPSGGILANRWYHIAYVRSGSGATVYYNGTSVATGTDSFNYTSSGSFNHIGTRRGLNQFMNGYVADFRVVKGTAVYTSNFTPPTTPLTAIANTSLLTLQYNGGWDTRNATILDEGVFRANLVRPVGSNVTVGTFSPQTPNTFGNIYVANVNGGSAYFDGTGDYIQDVSNESNAAYTLHNDFTAEAWIYPKSLSGTYTVFCLGSEGVNRLVAYIVNGQLTTNKYGNSSVSYVGANVAGNAWNHIAVSRRANTVYGFANGIISATNTSTVYGIVGNGGFKLGADSSASNPFYGYISGFRLSKQSLYNGNYTPNTAAVARSTGPTPTTLASANNVSSVKFIDSSPGSYLEISQYTPFLFSAGEFTVETWIYPTSINGNEKGIASNWSGGGAWIWRIGTGNTLQFVYTYAASGIASQTYTGSTTIASNAWSHVAIVRSGTILKFYINGVGDSTTYDMSSSGRTTMYFYNGATKPLRIGVNSDIGNSLDGYISNFRIIKGTALYTSNFTPSTTPLTISSQGASPSQVSILTCQSSTIIDTSPNSFAIATSGTPLVASDTPFILSYPGLDAANTNLALNFTSGGIIDYTGKGNFETANVGFTRSIAPKFNKAIGPFRRTGDSMIMVPHDPKYDFIEDTNPFTYEYWIYPTAFAGLNVNAYVMQKGALNGVTYPQWASRLTTDGNVIFQIGNSTSGSTESTLTGNIGLIGNAWNHVAHTRNIANVLTTWVNGNIALMTFQSITMASDLGRPLIIGNQTNGSGTGFDGYLENIRVTKGVCRYTAPFTPFAANTVLGNTTIVTSYQYTANSTITSSPSSIITATTTAPTGNYTNGEHRFTSSANWYAPGYVSSISLVGIGGGGGGGFTAATHVAAGAGGGLAWVNTYPVVAGATYTIVIGAAGAGAPPSTPGANGGAGGTTYFQSNINGILSNVIIAYGGGTVRANIGGDYFANSSYGTSGGGQGGNTSLAGVAINASGGGGAGGYTGPGGAGGMPSPGTYPSTPGPGSPGLGGGGGGGGGTTESPDLTGGGGGGGTGIWGQGPNGLGGSATSGTQQAIDLGYLTPTWASSGGGGGGSQGGSGNIAVGGPGRITGAGGNYGGGGGSRTNNWGNEVAAPGAQGAVRLIWGTMPRLFPNTFTSNSVVYTYDTSPIQ